MAGILVINLSFQVAIAIILAVIPIHRKFDTDANPKRYAEYHFLNFEFC
ncbi:hypothetical protein [Nostoc sp. CENA543]|nr:hypothetical protein [Nostoc sp. CENA543]